MKGNLQRWLFQRGHIVTGTATTAGRFGIGGQHLVYYLLYHLPALQTSAVRLLWLMLLIVCRCRFCASRFFRRSYKMDII